MLSKPYTFAVDCLNYLLFTIVTDSYADTENIGHSSDRIPVDA